MSKDKSKGESSKRPERRSKSKSKSSSKSRKAEGPTTKIYANFVIALAGLLSVFASRLYDMGDRDSGQASRPQDDTENTPLLGETDVTSSPSGIKKATKWITRHAVLLAIALLLTAVVIILCVFFGVYRADKPSKSSICNSPACVHASSEILYNLSPNYKDIDPCLNFEELTCGGWGDRHDLRPDQGDAFTGTIMSENSQMLLQHILEAPYPSDSKHSSFSPAQLLQTLSSVDESNFLKLKSAYDACMNEDKIKSDGVKPLLEILHQVADMFPVNTTTKAVSPKTNKDDLADTILYLSKLGVTSLVALGAGADDKDPDEVIVQVSPPYRIGLPAKDYYTDNSIVKKYEDALSQVIEKLRATHQSTEDFLAYSKSNAHEVVKLEKKLAAASPDAEDRDDVTKYYNPMSLKEADKLTPQIHLSTIINSLAPSDFKTQRLIVLSPTYMKTLSSILTETSREVLQSYFIWKVVQSYHSVLEADELKPYSQFSNIIQGKDPDSSQERWRTCVDHVDSGLGWILSRFFVEKAFSAKAKVFGDQIVTDIKDMFIEKLKATTWMDGEVIKLAIEKVHKIVQKIGYPTKSPDIMDPPSLLKYYQTVNITQSTFFSNALSMNRFEVSQEWSSLGKPVDRDQWGMTVPTVNAYYNPPGNEIVFPAGIMQFPVFDVNVPQYLSYGAFGSVSGHELSHAFDSTGRHYDQNGNYTDWWTDNTVKGFKDRAECFVEQYHNYTIPGPDGSPLHINGRLTLGENIADAGGVSAAFAAWKKRQAETPNQDLPGLDFFTQDQLFFVSYANWWCGKSRKETAISRIYTDPHAPKWARILGTMANSRDFKESFHCPSKKPVCELW